MKKQLQSKNRLTAKEIEKIELLASTHSPKNTQQLIDGMGALITLPEIHPLILDNVENPERKYDLYYHRVQKYMRKYLKDCSKEFKSMIYEEKNVFLTRGKRTINGRRGADSRMWFNHEAEEALRIVQKWVVESREPIGLYRTFLELNLSLGYEKPKELL